MNPDRETGGPRVYQRQDGTWGAQYEVTAQSIVFLQGRGDAGAPSGGGAGQEPAGGQEDYAAEDDIPF
jgi:single-strand DNA-binding protein